MSVRQLNLLLRLFVFNYLLFMNVHSQTIGTQYFGMNYTVFDALTAQLSLSSKLECFALCARQTTRCNMAIFNVFADPSCLLSNERFYSNRLAPMNNSIVIDFRRNNTRDEIFRTIGLDTSTAIDTTAGPRFITTMYGSIIDNGINDMRNDYIIFNRYESVVLPGCVNSVTVKFCTLPTTAQPVLWVYVVSYTGVSSFFIPYLMYQIPYSQINTLSAIQSFNISAYQLNVTTGQYVGIGFGKTTGGSPCRVIPGNSSFTNMYGGANQTNLLSTQSSYSYTTQARAVSISYTVLTQL